MLYVTQWKRICNPKNDFYLLAYDHRHPKSGVGVCGNPLRRGVGVGC